VSGEADVWALAGEIGEALLSEVRLYPERHWDRPALIELAGEAVDRLRNGANPGFAADQP
jgi:hypothetical protein